jgi:hypothetical protein
MYIILGKNGYIAEAIIKELNLDYYVYKNTCQRKNF